MTRFSSLPTRLPIAVACFIAGGIAAFFIRKRLNAYQGDLATGQVWFLGILFAIAGIVGSLKKSWRSLGLTLILMGVSLEIGAVSAFVPTRPLLLRPVVNGSFVRVHLRGSVTDEQESAFLCEYVYSTCGGPSGDRFRPEVNSLIRTGPNELTIGTTPELQPRLLDQVRRSPLVESAQAGPG